MPEVANPVVQLLFPCDEAKYDAAERRYTLIGPWQSTVKMPAGADRVLAELHVFAQVVDGVGEFRFRVEVRNEAGELLARSRAQECAMGVDGKLFAEQFAFALPDVEFSPGLHQVALTGNDAKLGTCLLRVLPEED